MGANYNIIGSWLRDDGSNSESLDYLGKAIQTLAPIHEQQPRDVGVKQALLQSFTARAITYHRLQKYAQAIKDWDQAIEFSPPVEQPGLRANRAISQLDAGRVAEAVAEVAELTKLPNGDANQWYNFACVYALASGKIADKKSEYADRAMQLLAKAVQAGWTNADHMRGDADLDPLRGRDDFRKLLADLEAKFPPKREVLSPPRREK